MKTRREFLKDSLGASAALLGPSISSAEASGGDAAKPIPADRREILSHSPHAAVKAKIECFDYRGVEILPGRLRQQIESARTVYGGLPNDDILKGFRRAAGFPAPGHDLGGWASVDSGVTFGQWLSGMARMSSALNDTALRDKAIALTEGWAATLGPGSNPRMGTYNFEKMMCGLVDLHLYANYSGAMPLLERTTEWAMKNFDRARIPATPWNRDGRNYKLQTEPLWLKAQTNEWYTLSENSYRAYLTSGNPLFLEFAKLWHYPEYWDKFETTNRPQKVAYLHAYSHVNTFCGPAMAYGASGDERYLRILKNARQWVQETQEYATGGYGPTEQLMPANGELGSSLNFASATAEIPCGSWAGFKLSRYLIGYTGAASYGDWIERLIYNGIGAALPILPDGTSFYYGDYRVDLASKGYYWSKWPCCSGTYIQAVADYHNVIYFKDAQGIYVNLAIPSTAAWRSEGQEITLRQTTDFPVSEETQLQVSTKKPVRFALRVRVPAWCSDCSLTLNGRRLSMEAKAQEWAVVDRTWNPGDILAVKFPMSLRLAPVDPEQPRRAALTYGPVVMAQNVTSASVPFGLRGDDPVTRLVRGDGQGLRFHAKDDSVSAQRQTSSFGPYYEIGRDQPYRMYFDLDAPFEYA